MTKRIAIAADHGGFMLKEICISWLTDNHWDVRDMGSFSSESVDYPDYILPVVDAVRSGQTQMGVLICGSGVGMSIGANRFKGIRAALCWNQKVARLSRQHNNANILVLGERLLRVPTALGCLKTFLETRFLAEERHARRLGKIDKYEEGL